MYVKYYMTHDPVTIGPATPIPEAREILAQNDFRHLPVVDAEGRLIGMVTDRDIRSAYPSSVLEATDVEAGLERIHKTPVEAIMSTYLLSLDLDSTLDDALILLEHQKIGALPVVDERRVVKGIFSIRDLMRAYGELFGLREKGSVLVAIKDDGSPGLLGRIVRLLEENEVPFTRLLKVRGKEGGDGGIVYVRSKTYNVTMLHKVFRDAGLELVSPGGH